MVVVVLVLSSLRSTEVCSAAVDFQSIVDCPVMKHTANAPIAEIAICAKDVIWAAISGLTNNAIPDTKKIAQVIFIPAIDMPYFFDKDGGFSNCSLRKAGVESVGGT